MTEKEFETLLDNSPLDEEEQWYEAHFDEFVPCENQEEMRKMLIEAAKNPPLVHKSTDKKPYTMRLDVGDVITLKDIAHKEGLPYQSLISSVLHKYATGTLVDVSEVKKLLKNKVLQTVEN